MEFKQMDERSSIKYISIKVINNMPYITFDCICGAKIGLEINGFQFVKCSNCGRYTEIWVKVKPFKEKKLSKKIEKLIHKQ